MSGEMWATLLSGELGAGMQNRSHGPAPRPPAPGEFFPPAVCPGGPSRLQALAATRWSEEAGGDGCGPGHLGGAAEGGRGGPGRAVGAQSCQAWACVLQAAAVRNATDRSGLDGAGGMARTTLGPSPDPRPLSYLSRAARQSGSRGDRGWVLSLGLGGTGTASTVLREGRWRPGGPPRGPQEGGRDCASGGPCGLSRGGDASARGL